MMYSDGLIGAKITTIFNDEHGLYGAKRIVASLKADKSFGPTNHKKVARLIKSHGAYRGLPPESGHIGGQARRIEQSTYEIFSWRAIFLNTYRPERLSELRFCSA
ncbi:transposase [Corynebacterium sp. KPL2734]|uniref:transposase n=1 Tax=Corynebacterium sp. KPL2734 TaxID=3158312 RepID=UPI0032EB5568